ncbi:MAG: amidohydrolase family protein, partial [Campylobacter sp.]|nr:amidohydrolase family protein [Campylobacter sp.]
MKIAIKNGTVVNHDTKFSANVLVEGDKIVAVTKEDINADVVIDASGKLVMPGFIDMHVHFRDPGYEYKDDIISGSNAAVAGGVT